MKTTIPSVLITFALACFALVQNTQAVSPAPDGGYPGNNTAEGTDALLHLTTGSDNTAVGSQALFSNTTGVSNTATGVAALSLNTVGSGNTATGGGRAQFQHERQLQHGQWCSRAFPQRRGHRENRHPSFPAASHPHVQQ